MIDEVKAGKPVVDVAKDFGISKTQVYTLLKSKESLQKVFTNKEVPVSSKVSKNKSVYSDVDEAVFEWFCSVRKLRGTKKPLPVSQSLIAARALLEARQRGYKDFKASNGWFSNWRWRYRVKQSVHLHGEAADVDIVAVEQSIEKLRTELQVYHPSNIFNMDETGLFFKAIPSHSYLMEDEGDKRQKGRGCKAMKAKDRLTAILCLNATGTCKIDPVIIGSAKKPRCFKDNPPCVPYFNQKNAWNDRVTYRKWWQSVFLPAICKWTSDPVALLVDGFSGHDDTCFDPVQQVKVFKFPPNVTSIYQPLDQGIIRALKAGYKNRLLSRLVDAVANFDILQALAAQLPAGCAGLQYGCPPHVADACQLLKEAWDNLTPSVIAGCWSHSQCLPVVGAAETVANSRDYATEIEKKTIDDMCMALSNVYISDPVISQMGLDLVVKGTHELTATAAFMLQKWLHLEEEGMLDVNDDGECEVDCDEQIQPLEKLNLLNQALPLLQELHAIGAKLSDTNMMSVAREMCVHIQGSIPPLPSTA